MRRVHPVVNVVLAAASVALLLYKAANGNDMARATESGRAPG